VRAATPATPATKKEEEAADRVVFMVERSGKTELDHQPPY
jgi:hypothetical protein